MKKYNKYYCKKDPAFGKVLEEDGKPVLGEIAKSDCPLEERHVKILNQSWQETGIFYAEMGNGPVNNDDEKALRKELFKKADELVEAGLIEKAPAKNIKTGDLKQLIGE